MRQSNAKYPYHVTRSRNKVFVHFSGIAARDDFFTLQRCVPGGQFITVSTMLSGGPAFQGRFCDEPPRDQQYRYRLRWIAISGEECFLEEHECSESFSCEIIDGNLMRLKAVGFPESKFLVAIYDEFGREVLALADQLLSAGSQALSCRLPCRLASGLYNIITSFSTSILSRSVIVS